MADPAELYERLLVPALFAPFSGRLVELARCPPGGALLDVACGTGVVARAAAEAGCGRVVGLDIAAGMLARASGEGVEWVEGDAAALPFDDASFDAVTCGFGLMFFARPVPALAELRRVLRPGGHLAASVWCGLEENPALATLGSALRDVAGGRAARILAVAFRMGDPGPLQWLFERSGLHDVEIHRESREARFASAAELALPYAAGLDEPEAAHAALTAELEARLGSGPLAFPVAALLVSARA